MTTNVKITTNGNYVAELKNSGGTVLGKAGPGQMAESGSIYIPHNETVTISERPATAEEIEALNKPAENGADDLDDDGAPV